MNRISKRLPGCAGLLCLLTSFNAPYANSGTAQQSLAITIPRVVLIELEQTQHAFAFTSGTNEIRHSTNVAISSNDRNAKLNIRVEGLPEAVQLDMAVNAEVCTGATTKTPGASNQLSCHIGISRTKDGLFTLTGSRKGEQTLPDGVYTAAIIYTLSD